jgi:hypothetical protein
MSLSVAKVRLPAKSPRNQTNTIKSFFILGVIKKYKKASLELAYIYMRKFQGIFEKKFGHFLEV